jgi:predicted peroxiredoxin
VELIFSCSRGIKYWLKMKENLAPDIIAIAGISSLIYLAW